MPIHVELCAAAVERAVCKVHIDIYDDGLPEWVQVLPAGPEIQAVDGRAFRISDPGAVVADFADDPNDIPIDYEHATEILAPKGEEAPAAGWVKKLEIREGSIWGFVEWTPRGASSIQSKEYKYLSPAFEYDVESGEVLRLISAGLTNRPALRMAALASKQTPMEVGMNPELLKALGLSEGATDEQVLEAVRALQSQSADAGAKMEEASQEVAAARAEVTKLKEANVALAAQKPALKEFVPRADHDVAVARVQELEAKLSERDAAELKKDVDAEIGAALKAGKITPATEGYHRSLCSTRKGLDQFRQFVSAAPVVAEDQRNLDRKGSSGDPTPTADDVVIAERCGISREQFVATLKAQRQ